MSTISGMAAERAPWTLTAPTGAGFTITFTRGISAEQVLAGYGAPASEAHTVPWSADSRMLRVGLLNRWAFGYEEQGTEGLRTIVLKALSEGTDTLVLHDSGSSVRFEHWRDSERLEGFEPGRPYSRPRWEPRPYWDRLQEKLVPGVRRAPAALALIEQQIRAVLTEEVLTGPLLSVRLDTSAPLPL